MLGVSCVHASRTSFMNAAQERRRLEEELRRQEVRVLGATSSLTLGDLAKRREGVTSFVASAGRGGASESPCGGRGRPGVSRINTLEIGASRRRRHAWRRSGSDRRFHARLQCRLRWPHVLARICPATIIYVTVQRCRRLQRPADKRSTAKLGKATACCNPLVLCQFGMCDGC